MSVAHILLGFPSLDIENVGDGQSIIELTDKMVSAEKKTIVTLYSWPTGRLIFFCFSI